MNKQDLYLLAWGQSAPIPPTPKLRRDWWLVNSFLH